MRRMKLSILCFWGFIWIHMVSAKNPISRGELHNDKDRRHPDDETHLDSSEEHVLARKSFPAYQHPRSFKTSYWNNRGGWNGGNHHGWKYGVRPRGIHGKGTRGTYGKGRRMYGKGRNHYFRGNGKGRNHYYRGKGRNHYFRGNGKGRNRYFHGKGRKHYFRGNGKGRNRYFRGKGRNYYFPGKGKGYPCPFCVIHTPTQPPIIAPTVPPTTRPPSGTGPVACVNDQPDETRDEGCTDEKPFCVATTGRRIELGATGNLCVPCLNNKVDGTADLGCSADPDKPLCRDRSGNDVPQDFGGDQCVACSLSKVVDVCLALDESGSINITTFNDDVKPFAVNLINSIDAETEQAEFAVVTFSDSSNIDTSPTLTTSADAVATVNDLDYDGLRTNTAAGINDCTSALTSKNPQRPKKMILFTDGNPTLPDTFFVTPLEAANNAASNAKNATITNATITIVTVGVKGQDDAGAVVLLEENLERWASNDGNGDPLSFLVEDFDDLNDALVQNITESKICLG